MKIRQYQNAGKMVEPEIIMAPRSTTAVVVPPLPQASTSTQPEQATVKQGTKTIGAKDSTHRVGQKSLFGERNQETSLASKLFGNLTDALHLTSPPSYTDGYGVTRSASVPLGQSAQGQQLKRMGKTALVGASIATLPYTFYYPLETAAAGALGWATGKGLSRWGQAIDNYAASRGYNFNVPMEQTLNVAGNLIGGMKGWNYGNNVSKRAIESIMHASPTANPLENFYLYTRAPKKELLSTGSYILTGKGRNTFGWNPALGQSEWYTGLDEFTRQNFRPEPGKSMIRSFLYGEPIAGLQESSDPGIFKNYIAENFPWKAGKIKTYSQKEAVEGFKPYGKVENIDATGSIPLGVTVDGVPYPTYYNVDAAGHRALLGYTADGIPIKQEMDIWKFNPKDYYNKWIKSNAEAYSFRENIEDEGLLYATKNAAKNYLTKYGLGWVNAHGTPVITKSPWKVIQGKDPLNLSDVADNKLYPFDYIEYEDLLNPSKKKINYIQFDPPF